MKQTWKRNNDAVSPVIATILMVAITVVLAAVLYVMVIGFGGDTNTTPAGTWTDTEATDSTVAKLEYGKLGAETAPKDVRVIISAGGTTVTSLTISADLATGDTNVTMASSGTQTAFYFDLNPVGNTIGSGDYIMVYGLSPDTKYDVQQFHVPSDAVMPGGDDSFQTLP